MKTMIDRPRGGLRPPDLRSMRFCLLVIAALVALPGRLSGGDGASVTITGKVVDRETKQPVRWCHIVPGIRSTRKGVRWDAAASVLVRNGRYQFKCPADAVPHVLKADGDEYQIAISKEIPGNAGTASIDFELTKLSAFAAIVLTPDRKPAVGAEVAVVLDNSPLVLHNGDSNVVVGSELSCQTDAFGEFQFRSRRQTIYLAITHPSGYAFFRPALNSKHRSINLDPWTRVEGTLRFDGKPLADTTVRSLTDRAPALDFDPASLFVPQPTAQTDADGRFVLDHLLYGSGRIGFRYPKCRDRTHRAPRRFVGSRRNFRWDKQFASNLAVRAAASWASCNLRQVSRHRCAGRARRCRWKPNPPKAPHKTWNSRPGPQVMGRFASMACRPANTSSR